MAESCKTCGVEVSGESFRIIPVDNDDILEHGTFCEEHWRTALVQLQAALENAEPGFEDVIKAVGIRMYFQRMEKLEREPMVADALWVLEQIEKRDGFWWRNVMCSGCYGAKRELDITTLPWWNASLNDYVTTYRCATCAPEAFADTRARLADANEALRICAMLERHGVTVLEYKRGDAPPTLKPIVETVLARLEDGSMVLPIGKTQSIT